MGTAIAFIESSIIKFMVGLYFSPTAGTESSYGFLLQLVLRGKRHTQKESRLIYIMILVASILVRPLCIQMKKGSAYLTIPIAPGDNIIGNGLSRGYFSHRLTKARKIRPCATCTQSQLG